MRGQKAKLLRKLTGFVPSEARPMHEVEHTVRHSPTRDLTGKVVNTIRTATLELNACPRVAYQMIKKSQLA